MQKLITIGAVCIFIGFMAGATVEKSTKNRINSEMSVLETKRQHLAYAAGMADGMQIFNSIDNKTYTTPAEAKAAAKQKEETFFTSMP